MHLPLIYSPPLSGYRTETCVLSRREAPGQPGLEAASGDAAQYFKPPRGESDQHHLSIRHPFNCSDELKWQVKMPPPQPPSMIYGKEAKTIIAFLLLLFFQG